MCNAPKWLSQIARLNNQRTVKGIKGYIDGNDWKRVGEVWEHIHSFGKLVEWLYHYCKLNAFVWKNCNFLFVFIIKVKYRADGDKARTMCHVDGTARDIEHAKKVSQLVSKVTKLAFYYLSLMNFISYIILFNIVILLHMRHEISDTPIHLLE